MLPSMHIGAGPGGAMHTVRDARVFVESLNFEQRRALASALLMYSNDASDDEQHMTALASRLCEAILLARTISHIGGWRHS